MAWTKYETPEEKKLLQERALIMKPNQPVVIATELGWAVPTTKGTLEILVRFDGLDALLGDEISEVEQVGEPLIVTPEAEVAEASPEEEVASVEEAVEVPKKKGGRPKKVAE